MALKSFNEVNKILREYIPAGYSMRGAYTLDKMRRIMEELGNPQEAYKVIHVAGTSGKTSTCYYLSAMLEKSGQKTGLTISPHVDGINERVQINLTPLPEAEFCSELSRFMKLVDGLSVKPTYFELVMAFAFWEFAESKVDYAVVEVGLGGLLDGSNVIHRADKVCVITDIGMDHTEILGQTYEAIAAQKAGIIHPYNPVIMYHQDEKVMNVVREVAAQQQAELHEILPQPAKTLPKSLPLFQRRNWYLALSAYDFVASRDGLPQLDEKRLAQTASIYVPARMETLKDGGKTIVLDVAHNSQKMKALIASIKSQYPKDKFAVLLSMSEHRKFPLQAALRQVLSIASHVIITTFRMEQEVHKQPINPLKVAEVCAALGFDDIEIIETPEEAFTALKQRPEKHLLVTGSFYLLNHIRPLLKQS